MQEKEKTRPKRQDQKSKQKQVEPEPPKIKKRNKKGLPVEPKTKRTKERTISEIIDKVSHWRKLYNGSETSEHRWSLEEAAAQVGVSKKSLDDYLL